MPMPKLRGCCVPWQKASCMENPAAPFRYLKRNKLKRHLAIPLLLLVLACNNNAGTADNGNALPEESETRTAAAPDLFPEVTAFYRQQDPGFDPAGYELAGEQTGNNFLTRPFDKQETQDFLPLLIYNTDSSRAIDMYSGSYVAVQKNGDTVYESGSRIPRWQLLIFKKKNA